MFALGEQVWVAVAKKHEAITQTCPDCCGQRFLTVILGDASQVTIECSTCASGYNPPRGYVLVDTYKPDALLSSIREIAKDDKGEVVYSGDGFYHVVESELNENKESALTLAAKKAAKADDEEKTRLQRKEKDSRTWAWHVTYHRRCVKQAEKDLAYHTSKLNVSLQHKKAEE